MSYRTSKNKLEGASVTTGETLGLDWVVRALYHRRFIVAAAIMLGVIFSLLYLQSVTPQFVATTRILIEDKSPRIASGLEIVPLDQLNTVPMLSQVIDSQIALIQSPQQIEKVIDQLTIFERPDGSGGQSVFDKFFTFFHTFEPTGSADRQSARKTGDLGRREKQRRQFFQKLNVRRLNQTSIILVSYSDTDRDRAAKVANAVAEAYMAQQFETINDVKRQAVGWLKARAAELREEVLAQERKIEEYKSRYGLISVDGKMLLEREVISTMERLIETRAEAAGAKARAKLFGGGRSDAEVAKLSASIQEKDLKRLIDELASATDVMVRLRELELEHKASRDVYAGVLSRLKEGQVQTSLQTTQSRIVNEATPPLRPEWPRKSLVLIVGSVGSAWLAMTVVLLQEFYQGVVRSPKDISQKVRYITTFPIVGPGPSSRWLKKFGVAASRTWLKKLVNQLLPKRSTEIDNTRINWQAPGDMASPYAQSLFTLSNSMYPGQAKGGSVVAVVSAQRGEGKTMTALNLADYAARARKKVLLIDADLRRPALTETYAPLPVMSLVDIAEQKVDGAEVIINGTFDFCPAPDRHACERPMEILASDGVTRLLQKARADYDLVLIDTSPLLSYVDTKALTEKVDSIVLLVECNRTTRAQIDEVLEVLGEHCGKMLGFALNKARPRNY